MSTAPQQAEQHHRIDYIELPVKDIAEAKRFYGAVFGWRFEDYGPDYTSFMDGRLNGGFDKEREVSKGGALLVLYSKDLDATLAKVREAGGRIVKDTFSFPGGKRFHFTDPTGNELAVWTEPS
ncbi:VOC family protein [Corallococcus caeni]|uniref:VOC family protein n=3 Tax=Corallococcus TaxID=83461 RepID=A0A7Y4JWJ1_9BACT|nr:VOC family protein [Corallococcus exercitus]NOK12493.1 VOC family protein [Corallococcus exercitus]GMT97761.1 VOC family protein [Corallococcus sp. KH5-1]GMU07446.1 VOC family protein [Corallococcus sp. NO1]